jgi:hypothetical protein
LKLLRGYSHKLRQMIPIAVFTIGLLFPAVVDARQEEGLIQVGIRGHRVQDPMVTASINAVNDALHMARKAYKEGKYKQAADHFTRARMFSEAGPIRGLGEPVISLGLARIYAKQGKDADTYRELGRVVYPPKTLKSSYAQDPRILLYFGELAGRLSQRDEAEMAYRAAISSMLNRTEGPTQMLFSDELKQSSLTRLRSSAFAAAGLAFGGGSVEGIRYAEASVFLAPESALARYIYASLLERSGVAGRPSFRSQLRLALELARGRAAIELRKTDGMRVGVARDGSKVRTASDIVAESRATRPKQVDFSTNLPDD